jgi:hypothetical protein
MTFNVFRVNYRKKHSYSDKRIANPSAITKDNAEHYPSHAKHGEGGDSMDLPSIQN